MIVKRLFLKKKSFSSSFLCELTTVVKICDELEKEECTDENENHNLGDLEHVVVGQDY